MKSEILDMAKKLVEMIEKDKSKNKVRLSELKQGERFSTNIGNFIVLDQCGSCTKVIAEKLFMDMVGFDDDSTDYRESGLREVFNGKILEKFIDEFGADNLIAESTDLVTVDGQHINGSIVDYVRPLTFDEVRKYNSNLVDKSLPDWWWTCTAWSSKERGWEYSVAVVSPSGNFSNFNYGDDSGVRPFCILKSNIFVSKGE